jgi:hypothetical protein
MAEMRLGRLHPVCLRLGSDLPLRTLALAGLGQERRRKRAITMGVSLWSSTPHQEPQGLPEASVDYDNRLPHEQYSPFFCL